MKRNSYSVAFQSALLTAIGLSLIVQPVLGFISQHFHRLHITTSAIPYGISSQLILTIIGISLLYFTFYLYKRREIAYFASISLSLCALAVMLLQRHKSIVIMALLTGFLIWMFFSRRYYKTKSDLVSLAFGVRVALTIGFIGYIYGCLGFLLLGPNGFHSHFTIGHAAYLSFQTLLTFQDVDTPTYLAEMFVYSLNAVGVLLIILIVSSLFKPVRFALTSSHDDKKRVMNILQKTSVSSEDYFKLWPDDKRYYFSRSRNSFLAYKTSGHTAIILGDPSGDSAEFTKLIQSFKGFVQSNGWLIASINATTVSNHIYQQEGLKELFIGNEAILSIPDYITYTARSKHFRYIYNKAKRDGLVVEYWQSLGSQKIAALKRVSDSWLSRNGRKEYTFFMGYFDAEYLRNGSVMVVKQASEVVAYINIIPSFVENEASIDHLRSVSGASPAAMHYLLAELISKLHDDGKQLLNIGFAPLSGIEQQDSKRLGIEQLLKLIKKIGNRYYSFQGVEQFKGKFQPSWHPRYLYYSASLTTVVRDIEQASKLSSTRIKRGKILGTAILIIIVLVLIQFI